MGTVNKGEDARQLERGYLGAGGSPDLWLWWSPAVGAGLGVPRGCLPCPELQGEEPSVDIPPQATQVTVIGEGVKLLSQLMIVCSYIPL